MSCAEYERTSAYLDGELDAQASTEAERHIQTCGHCKALISAAGDASEALRGKAARLATPASLRVRIARSLDDETSKVVSFPYGRRPRQFWVGAASGVGASALAAAVALAVLILPAARSLSTALVDDHIQTLSSGRVIAVASSDHHTVKPWFAGRAPLSPPVSDFGAQGFLLTGGRVAMVAGRKAAVVVYYHGAHEIDLYIWPSHGVAPPPFSESRGYHLISWQAKDLTLSAVSDLQWSELGRFAHFVRSARE